MERRKFLELMGYGLASGFLPWRGIDALADTGTSTPLLFCFNARGGWDPTIHCDPQGHESYAYFSDADIRETSTGIKYAPMRHSSWSADQNTDGLEEDYNVGPAELRQSYFEKYKNELLVINGIDAQTVSHDVGTRNMWSGTTREGHPCLAALAASIHGDTQPVPFITTGGFDATAGLLAPTRSGSTDTLLALVQPFKVKQQNIYNDLMPPSVQALIADAQAQRLTAQAARSRLPRRQGVSTRLGALRIAENSMSELGARLEEISSLTIHRPSNNSLVEDIDLAVAGMLAGITTSAQFVVTGFDTHQDHFDYEDGQRSRLKTLFEAQDYTVELLKAVGLYQRSIFMMGSDFGRTRINSPEEMGKDHWSVGSVILMGAGIRGGRTIGQTWVEDCRRGVSAAMLDPDTLLPTSDVLRGVYVSPAHIHLALREKLSISGHTTSSRFLFSDVQYLPLLD